MKHLIRKFGVIFVTCTATLLLFSFSNPQTAPAIILIAPFVLLFIVLYYLIEFFLKQYFFDLENRSSKKRKTLALIISLIPVSLLALQTIGQLTVRDSITFILLLCVLCLYITRTSFV